MFEKKRKGAGKLLFGQVQCKIEFYLNNGNAVSVTLENGWMDSLDRTVIVTAFNAGYGINLKSPENFMVKVYTFFYERDVRSITR